MPINKTYISHHTNRMLQRETIDAIKKYSDQYGVEAALVKAIIKQESYWSQFAIRMEPHLQESKWYTNTLDEHEKKDPYAYCSYGKMQVLYGTAKSMGYIGPPAGLLRDDESIKYGVKCLSNLHKRYYFLNDIIAAYNAGSPRRTESGEYRNQNYVDAVRRFYNDDYNGRVVD